MTIRTRPATREYRENFDRVFGRESLESAPCRAAPPVSALERIANTPSRLARLAVDRGCRADCSTCAGRTTGGN